ncbi:hypothetical protein SCLCIDRAFT_133118 [Scleroderma citrinum Foug A]|uniref:SAP domain-containing protein n=1 Tax=Scleroderma citrinum Foug A TaxID=1036808 RepID=A0A0C3DIU7_9AGAM|nr:hypothetical protein SCLCIDRAFT_133118 [Scleroderma citrinum Foug A]
MAPTTYSGALQPKKKAELLEIALALDISEKGTKEEIQARIKKHLDDNPHLGDNPAFTGLFGRRKRSVQPHLPSSCSVPSSTSESAADAVAKKTGVSVKTNGPVHTRASRRSAVLDAVREGTPVPEAREVSMMFKNPPLSPEEPTSTLIATQTPSRGIAGPLVTSTPRSVLRNIPKPSIQLATSAFQRIQTDTRQTANKLLLASRLVLSNSTNVWLISVLLELLYILYIVIPWKTIEVILFPVASNLGFSIYYPPLATFASPTFWMILIHWAGPSIIIPAIFGSLVSFHPAISSTARAPRASFFDPLTASVIRVAAQYAYPYDALKHTTECIDILGPKWRLLDASVAAALAFAEAIAAAPGAYADPKQRQRVTKRSTLPEGTMP